MKKTKKIEETRKGLSGMAVMLETSLGDMVFDLHTDLCPKVVRFFSRALFRSPAASLDAGAVPPP